MRQPKLTLNVATAQHRALRHASVARTVRATRGSCALHRPIGIWLLLWPTLWALWIASARAGPTRHVFVIFVARHDRDALGRLRDQRFRRPQHRSARRAHARTGPLATRRGRAVEALLLFAALMLIALVWC